MTNEEHIEQLKKLRSFHNGSYGRSINKAIEALKQEPKTGHWIYTGDYLTEGMLKCSECGEEIDVSESYYDFCPVCGCRMVEPQESEE